MAQLIGKIILISCFLIEIAHSFKHNSIGNATCDAAWAKCGGQNWTGPIVCCNDRYYCKESDEYYSECIPKPAVPFPPAPPSAWCGPKGMTLNKTLLKIQGQVTPFEIAQIWNAATKGLTAITRANGSNATCIQAVSTSLGECAHPQTSNWMTIDDGVCALCCGGIWQVTSADSADTTTAGCSNGEDPCCDARIAYAHAYNQGGATYVPGDYCNHLEDCTQITSACGGTGSVAWNDPTVDKTKPNATIPDCNYQVNPWYPDGGKELAYVSIDQEPCYWGPFSIAGGGVGREFFTGFYGWGGWFQHYLNSKAGRCDPSPQCGEPCNPNNGTYAKYPSYIQLAVEACNA
eukprot:147812_1